MNGEYMRDNFLESRMIFVVMTLSSSMSFAEVGFLRAIKSDCNVGSFKRLLLVDVHKSLNDLSSNKTDQIVLQLDENLTALKRFLALTRALAIAHTSFF